MGLRLNLLAHLIESILMADRSIRVEIMCIAQIAIAHKDRYYVNTYIDCCLAGVASPKYLTHALATYPTSQMRFECTVDNQISYSNFIHV